MGLSALDDALAGVGGDAHALGTGAGETAWSYVRGLVLSAYGP